MGNANVSLNSLSHFICDKGGVVKLSELCGGEFFSSEHNAKMFLEKHRQYFKLEPHEGIIEVHAFTPVKLCDEFDSKKRSCPVPDCDKLHLCKHHVTGHCTYGLRCKNIHDIHDTSHNQQVLQTHQLEDLDDDVIMKMLKLSCVEFTIPDVCTFYNSTKGCRNANKCTFLHVCLHFINGNCKFENGCKRSHNIHDSQPLNVLHKFGIDTSQSAPDLVRILRYKRRVERGRDELRDGASPLSTMISSEPKTSAPVPLGIQHSQSSDNVNQEKYICIFHLSSKCQYDEKCFNLHTDEPFLWQFQDGEWKNFDQDDNILIETTFCSPMKNKTPVSQNYTSKIGTGEVDFTSMKISISKKDYSIRRISTNVENQGWKQSFSTKWLWYWEDNGGKYVEYGKQSKEGTEAGIDSSSLEEAYTKFLGGNHEGKVQFRTGRFTHEICFQDMKQNNIQTKKVRKLKRRPLFACKADVNLRAKRFKDLPSDIAIPDTWDLTVTSSEADGFQLCRLTSSSNEYKEVERKFTSTLPTLSAAARVISIKRLQNMELWDDFSRKRRKMERKNGDVELKPEFLFHGTTDNVISAICQQSFDHRLSGTRVGAKYGQGSYFHKSANYSNNYAKKDASGHKHMFLSRVLVGSYTKGIPEHRRPPPKDPKRPLEDFYDTCVDSVSNPNIFVVFDNHQVYPEYIITYRP